jgi:hypothetical protein
MTKIRKPHDMKYLLKFAHLKTKEEIKEAINAFENRYKFELYPCTFKVLKYWKSFRGAFHGYFKHSQKTLAGKTKQSERSVQRALKQLRELGLIEKVQTYKIKSGHKSTDCIVILPFAVDMSPEVSDNQEAENVDTPRPEEAKKESYKGLLKDPLDPLSNNVSNYKTKFSKSFHTTIKKYTKKGQALTIDHKRMINPVLISFVGYVNKLGYEENMISLQEMIGKSIDLFIEAYKAGYTCITNPRYLFGILKNQFLQREEAKPSIYKKDETLEELETLYGGKENEQEEEEKASIYTNKEGMSWIENGNKSSSSDLAKKEEKPKVTTKKEGLIANNPDYNFEF